MTNRINFQFWPFSDYTTKTSFTIFNEPKIFHIYTYQWMNWTSNWVWVVGKWVWAAKKKKKSCGAVYNEVVGPFFKFEWKIAAKSKAKKSARGEMKCWKRVDDVVCLFLISLCWVDDDTALHVYIFITYILPQHYYYIGPGFTRRLHHALSFTLHI